MNQTIAALLRAQDSKNDMSKTVTQQQYQVWKQKLLFDRLQGLRTGQSFCNEFDITDNILYYNALNEQRLLEYIEKNYVKS